MYITNENTATRRLFNADLTDEDGEPLMDEPVEFAKNGTAQVTADVGEALVEQYDSITPKE
ncbi:hypothetical protein [Natronorubrum halophilum]|uniref:hypothetical protein n=1 Tax=Natronorubrum halophilum TaxID=1702106 RepID=UPI0010C1E6AA|nr:hypothetical protein [Natronorubrum halophilum]